MKCLYMGNLFSSRAFGKFGGTGTFIVADPPTDLNVVFLTNRGWPGLSGLDGFEKWFEELRVREFFDLVNSAISR
jgi:CubicO group peptidase (beta-lactamase class C family)